MNGEKVLVTGSCGFIGHHLVKGLKDKGYYVIGIDDLSNGNADYQDYADEFYRNSVVDFAKDIKGVKYVFHTAALPRVQYSIDKPLESNRVNVEGTLRMLTWANNHGVSKFIYSSSSSAYGGQTELPFHEDMREDPKSPYAIQKLTGEQCAEVFRSDVYNLPTVSLRYFNVYGEDQDGSHPYATVVAKFLELRKNGQPLTIFGDGTKTRDMTYVGDVVVANIASAESDAQGVFNIGAGKNYSVSEIAVMIGGSVEHLPERLGEAQDSLADITKAQQAFGFKVKTSLPDWLASQLENM